MLYRKYAISKKRESHDFYKVKSTAEPDSFHVSDFLYTWNIYVQRIVHMMWDNKCEKEIRTKQ